IALHGKEFQEDTAPYIQEVFDILKDRQATVLVSRQYKELLKAGGITSDRVHVYSDEDTIDGTDFFISLGGDGTLLESVTHIGRMDFSIVLIIMGRLGFMLTTPTTHIQEACLALYNNRFTYDYRTLIRLESDRGIFGKRNGGMSEIALLQKDASSMIAVHT